MRLHRQPLTRTKSLLALPRMTNPRSFWLLPEYRDSSISQVETTQEFLQSRYSCKDEGSASVSSGSITWHSEDPNTIILRAFEESARRGSKKLPTIPSTPLSSYAFLPVYPLQGYPRGLPHSNMSRLDNARAGGRDSEL
jgi:hypothetical protein